MIASKFQKKDYTEQILKTKFYPHSDIHEICSILQLWFAAARPLSFAFNSFLRKQNQSTHFTQSWSFLALPKRGEGSTRVSKYKPFFS